MEPREIAKEFLLMVAYGKSVEAFQLYCSDQFKHHNPYFRSDAATVMTAMDASAQENPERIFEIKRIIADGELVAIHSFLQQFPLDKGMAVVHIFRFENGKIAELWDVAQAIPEDLVNESGMF